MASDRQPKFRYGIAEWYGQRVESIPLAARVKYAEIGTGKLADQLCPFRQAASPGAKCHKKGGVCTLRRYAEHEEQGVIAEGPLVTICPSRFWDQNRIFEWIGHTLLHTDHPTLVKEVPFLNSSAGEGNDEEAPEEDGTAVGRIDLVLVDPNDNEKWCALELQAVYFSGDGMGTHLKQYAATNGAYVYPDKGRRPDYRSSGPKRLMPQLQTKVPSLRRWGKKMVVLVDKPFFSSLGKLTKVPHVSNCDIIWFVVDYDEQTSEIIKHETIFTTLESSVEALTAGTPRSLEKFQAEIDTYLQGKTKKVRAKVVKLFAPE